MTIDKTVLWLKRITLTLSSMAIGFAAAIALLIYYMNNVPRHVPPDFSKLERLTAMEDVVRKIVETSGLHTNIPVYLDTYNPWWCSYSSFQARTILVTSRCSRVTENDGTYDWRNVGVVAYETGHILNSHWGDTNRHSVRDDDVEREQREAEEFAGFALKRIGATLEQAQSYAVPPKEEFSETIPPDPKSLAAIKRGWQRG